MSSSSFVAETKFVIFTYLVQYNIKLKFAVSLYFRFWVAQSRSSRCSGSGLVVLKQGGKKLVEPGSLRQLFSAIAFVLFLLGICPASGNLSISLLKGNLARKCALQSTVVFRYLWIHSVLPTIFFSLKQIKTNRCYTMLCSLVNLIDSSFTKYIFSNQFASVPLFK